MADFKIDGLDELIAELELAEKEVPDQANNAMRYCGNGWKKDVNSKMPSYYEDLPKGWKTSYRYSSLGVIEQLDIVNRRPHWHLVENGHRKFDFRGHPTGGFVAGRHYAADTTAEWETKFPETLDARLSKALKKAGFD